jgi:hypothetical protein
LRINIYGIMKQAPPNKNTGFSTATMSAANRQKQNMYCQMCDPSEFEELIHLILISVVFSSVHQLLSK